MSTAILTPSEASGLDRSGRKRIVLAILLFVVDTGILFVAAGRLDWIEAWLYTPGGLAAVALVVRTALEDRTLQAELPGYQEFTGRTRYRLFPGIW